ncbi:phosphoribosylformylglycinamidine synthase [Coemansia sp. Cherry 401B]|nr:phosphoribosylformylglycinamidine synthase [Coemansia sp. Cherry 401B]
MCKCQAQQSIAGYFNNCPSDEAHTTNEDQATASCNAESVPKKMAEALLPTAPENVWATIATLLCTPSESGAPQAAIQWISDNQDPDYEKHELANKERELWVLPRRCTIRPWLSKATDVLGLCGLDDVVPRAKRKIVYCIAFVDDFTIPQFRPLEHKHIINAGSNRMAEPSDGDELARPIRNIKAAQLQGIAEKNKSATFSVLVWANRELGLVLATDEIAYLIDAYLDMQATDARIARNQTDAELMITISAFEDAKRWFVKQKSAAAKYADPKDERIPYPVNLNGNELNVVVY